MQVLADLIIALAGCSALCLILFLMPASHSVSCNFDSGYVTNSKSLPWQTDFHLLATATQGLLSEIMQASLPNLPQVSYQRMCRGGDGFAPYSSEVSSFGSRMCQV